MTGDDRTMTKGPPPSRLTLSAFSAPTLPLAALGLPLVVYLPEYYANHLGLNLAMVGFAFMAVRFSDIFLDPIFGEMMDRTRTRMGRFRPWMLLNTPILVLSTYMLFMAEKGVGPVYLWFWLALTYITYSAVVLAHTSWASVLSSDYNQRSRIYGFWQAGNVIGMILVLALPPILSAVAHMDYAGGLQAMGWFIVILLPLTILLATKVVGEPVNLAPVAHRPANLKAYFDLFKNDSVRRIMLADLGTSIADPVKRLHWIHSSTLGAKEHLQSLPKSGLNNYTMLFMAPYIMGMLTGAAGRIKPMFNLAISNVPGPDQTLYLGGAKLEAMYPVSVLMHGQALNITCLSYAGKLNFGFTGARDALPHMQRLAVYTGEALDEQMARPS